MEQVKPRPAIFRALGHRQPPAVVSINGVEYQLDACLKHDSWAATARYVAPTGKVVCKFNREHRIGIMPMKWLGRQLARREAAMLTLLADQANVPRLCGEISTQEGTIRTAVAHQWIDGHPLASHERVSDRFFEELRGLLAVIHARGAAYVDLHKRENIIVDDDGRPFLVDFQVCCHAPTSLPGRLLTGWFVRIMQQCDTYHLMKHMCRHRPDLLPEDQRDPGVHRPMAIRVFRVFGNRFRAVRRKLLVLVGVRRGRGSSHTEIDPEDAVRRELANRQQAQASDRP